MSKLKLIHYKLSLIFIACLALSIFAYVQWVAINFNIQHAANEGVYLSDFTDRAISRIKANPQWYVADEPIPGKSLGSHRLNLVRSYDDLKKLFPEVPPIKEMKHNKMFVVTLNLRGLLKVPNFLIIKPIFLGSGQKYFAYLHVESELNDQYLDETLEAEIQPVLFIALGSIVIMFIVQLKHINSINNTALAMAKWADSLNTSNSVAPAPNFNLPRLNHIAFTINQSLSTLGQVLEKEQSFAKYTSHELRTPVAALSANIELLEMMMQDLSPKERQVLQRMETAIADMKYQMEAMLWVSKEIEIDSELQLCDIREMAMKSIEDNTYLLNSKSVEVSIEEQSFKTETHPTLFQIVLNNLVRNAFQNTLEGEVAVGITPNTISISNSDNTTEQHANNNESFGIGLVLVEKLINKLNIHMETIIADSGRTVKLSFRNLH